MSETIEVKAHLTAEDDASPVIRALLRNVQKLEKGITKAFGGQFDKLKSVTATADRALAAQRQLQSEQRRHFTTITGAGKREAVNVAKDLRSRLTFQNRMIRQKAVEERRSEATIGRDLKRRLTFEASMTRQRLAEERRAQADAMRSLRQRTTFAGRMAAQRDREARQIDAERRRTDLAHNRQLARRERDDRTGRQRLMSSGRDVMEGGRSLGRSASLTSAAVVGGAGYAAGRLLGMETRVDDAEINARIYGGLSKDEARKLRSGWAEPKAVAMGSTAEAILNSYTEALKIGIPKIGAESFTELAVKASEGWQKPMADVSDFLGNVNTILGGFGDKYDPKKLKSVANVVTNLAAQMSTSPEKLMSFMQRGAGAASSLGMSQEAGLAFGAAATSAGVEAGSAGRMFDYLATFVNTRWGQLTKNPGMQDHGLAVESLRLLGYGSYRGLQNARDRDPDNFMADLVSRLSNIKNPNKKREVAEFITGTEWSGELGRLIDNPAIMKEAMKHLKASKSLDALGDLWALHTQKLSFSFKQMNAAFRNIMGQFGEVLSPFAKDVGDFFVKWSQDNKGALKVNFWAAMRGLVEGFLGGPGTFRDLLKNVFGGSGMKANPKAFFEFAKGLAEGLRSIGTAFMSFLRTVGNLAGIDSSTAAGAGELAGKLLGLSLALAALSPLLGVLGALGTAIFGLVGALAAVRSMGLISTLAGVGAASGGAGAAAGAGIGALARKFAARFLPLALVSGSAWALWNGPARQPESERAGYSSRGKRMTTFKTASRLAGMVEPMQDAQTMARALSTAGKSPLAERRLVDLRGKLADLDKRLAEIDRSGTATGTAKAALDQLTAMRADIARLLGEPVPKVEKTSSVSSSSTAAAPSSLGSAAELSGALSGADAAAAVRAGSVGGKGMLDAIASAEGTLGRGDYDASLGYGKFLPGGKERKLTDKTLSEIYLLGLHMRKQPGNPNSSALGRYQIVGKTMLDAARALGMDPMTTKFDEKTQDAMAEWIAKRQGLGAWQGFNRNPEALAAARTAMAGGGGATAAVGAQSGAVDVAAQMMGLRETGSGRSTLNAFMGQGGFNLDAARTAWCAAFVNSSLKAVGINGTGSKVANSFLKWGNAVDPKNVLKGDVLVEHRGRGYNATGGHVGMATGKTRIGPNGQQQIEMISGNSGGRRAGGGEVQTTWEDASALAVRRAASAVPPTGASIAANVPAPTAAPRGGAGGVGSGGTVHAPIVIHGGGSSPDEIAQKVQRRIDQRRRLVAHDIEYEV